MKNWEPGGEVSWEGEEGRKGGREGRKGGGEK